MYLARMVSSCLANQLEEGIVASSTTERREEWLCFWLEVKCFSRRGEASYSCLYVLKYMCAKFCECMEVLACHLDVSCWSSWEEHTLDLSRMTLEESRHGRGEDDSR